MGRAALPCRTASATLCRAEMVRLTCCPLGASASATLGLMTSRSCWHPPRLDPPRTRYVRFGQEGAGPAGVVENPRGVAQLAHTPPPLQILLHPYVYTRQAPLLAYTAAQGIVSEAYSALTLRPPSFLFVRVSLACNLTDIYNIARSRASLVVP